MALAAMRYDINLEIGEEPCLIERSVRILGGKWKASILWHLKDGLVRFNELPRMLDGAGKKMVDQCLKELEIQGLVSPKVTSGRPIDVSYDITGFGRSALEILDKLKYWTEENDI
jgi:DNA-binding HxlR family transcriptional regulator